MNQLRVVRIGACSLDIWCLKGRYQVAFQVLIRIIILVLKSIISKAKILVPIRQLLVLKRKTSVCQSACPSNYLMKFYLKFSQGLGTHIILSLPEETQNNGSLPSTNLPKILVTEIPNARRWTASQSLSYCTQSLLMVSHQTRRRISKLLAGPEADMDTHLLQK